ncbi:hypothetical protein O3P69_015299 [Scylla paramamosain]|uniref:Peptidase A2 domain-containing protein n=1 Tax=Scylla paramamosain TaxID=85552 RepID=A0AAW0T3X8_SCYPA
MEIFDYPAYHGAVSILSQGTSTYAGTHSIPPQPAGLYCLFTPFSGIYKSRLSADLRRRQENEESRREEDLRRRQEEEERRRVVESRREAVEARYREGNERFMALLQMMSTQAMPAQHLSSSSYSLDPMSALSPQPITLQSPGKRRDKAPSSLQQVCSRQRGKPPSAETTNPASVAPASTCPVSALPPTAPATTADARAIGQGLPGALPRKSSVAPARRLNIMTGAAERKRRITDRTAHTPAQTSSCRRVTHGPASNAMTPKPVCIYLTHGGSTSHLQILSDTGADVIVIGQRHLGMLQIPRSSLQPLSPVYTLTADGSEMAPPLGCFQATLRLGQWSYVAQIQVHEGIQIPLLFNSHCKELAIISPEFPKPILKSNMLTSVANCPSLPPRSHLLRRSTFFVSSRTCCSSRRI